MGPRQRKPAKRTASTARARTGKARHEVVREPRVSLQDTRAMVEVVDNGSAGRSRGLGLVAIHSYARKLIRHLAPSAVALTVALVGVAAIGNRYEATVENARIEPSVVQPGGYGVLRFHSLGLDKVCQGVVTRTIIDAQKIPHRLPETDTVKFDKATNQFERPFPVPLGTAPGPAIYVGAVVRWCNPIQKFFWPIVSTTMLPFTVGNEPVTAYAPPPKA